MYMLAIETTGPNASVALFHAENPDRGLTAALAGEPFCWAKTSREGKTSENLMPLVRDLLADCGVTQGTADTHRGFRRAGSFTGIRIGVATARALAQVLELPCVAVPTLEAFFMRRHQTTRTSALSAASSTPDADRFTVYWTAICRAVRICLPTYSRSSRGR